MKIHASFWMMVLLVGWMLVWNSPHIAIAAAQKPFPVGLQRMSGEEAAQTPVPTQAEIPDVTETPEERILPPVGDNAGLVLGASVLVLIILGGVMLLSRKKVKH
jgi:hypothetical protein